MVASGRRFGEDSNSFNTERCFNPGRPRTHLVLKDWQSVAVFLMQLKSLRESTFFVASMFLLIPERSIEIGILFVLWNRMAL